MLLIDLPLNGQINGARQASGRGVNSRGVFHSLEGDPAGRSIKNRIAAAWYPRRGFRNGPKWTEKPDVLTGKKKPY